MNRVPYPMRADAYTISGEAFAGERAKALSVYNLTNRISPRQSIPDVADDSRMVFYGLSEFIRRHLTTPVTHEDIDRSVTFLSTAHSFGGALPFPEKTWRRVVDEFGGYIPVRIEALPEGSTFFPYEPVVQVTSLGEGFGEIAAHVEAVLLGMVSTMSARATICRHWLDRIREEMMRNNPEMRDKTIKDLSSDELAGIDGMARFFIHDFGMRASSCEEESELLGMAHLLVFHGTDTFNAAFTAMERGAERPTGTSILALAHRIVQGHETEDGAFDAIYEASSGNDVHIASYVADCYNFHGAVKNHLKSMAQRAEGCVVVRPDSGDYIENCLFVAQQAYEAGLHDGAERPGATTMRFIEGDSMNPDKVDEVFNALYHEGFNSAGWGIFGIGGYLRNSATRDVFSSAFKLAACGANSDPEVKLSDTPAKMSVPGVTEIRRGDGACFGSPSVFFATGNDARVTFYDGVKRLTTNAMRTSFAEISKRTIEDFDSFAGVEDSYGESDGYAARENGIDVLAPELRKFQQDCLDKHRAEINA